jgi:hypothetical protein
MRLFRLLTSSLIGLFCCLAAARAETPTAKIVPVGAASPLRLMPEQADLFVEVRQPRRLAETLTTLDLLKQFEPFPVVRELYDSTSFRRFQQLLAYFEKELGASWPDLLDRLAGKGAALGFKLGPKPAPTLLVLEGQDEKLTQRFVELGLSVLEQELARQDAKERPVKKLYQGIEVVQVGPEFHLAVAGSALLLSNSDKALHAGLDRYLGQGKSVADVPGVAEAAHLLPPNPLAALWLNMKTVQQAPQAKALYQKPRDDVNLTVLFGDYLDLLGRTPFVCAGVYPEKNGFLATIRLPRGREGMGPDQLMHVPVADQPGLRPLLEPRGVLYSETNYLNIASIWQDRAKHFNARQVKGLEEFDRTSGRFLSGVQMSKLLAQTTPYYRFVAANQPKAGYAKAPRQAIPAFALVWQLREPEAFGQSMETILRGAALLARQQFKLQLVEDKHNDCAIVGYRFSETESVRNDVNGVRFNFSPCFTRVGDQFVWCSTIELCRELIDLLQKERSATATGETVTKRGRIYASGITAFLDNIREQLITGTILDQAVPLKEAGEQVQMFLDLTRRLGTLTLSANYTDTTFHYDIHLQTER